MRSPCDISVVAKKYLAYVVFLNLQGPFLLTWMNFNLNMDKWLHPLIMPGMTFPKQPLKFGICHFPPIRYWARDYLSMNLQSITYKPFFVAGTSTFLKTHFYASVYTICIILRSSVLHQCVSFLALSGECMESMACNLIVDIDISLTSTE